MADFRTLTEMVQLARQNLDREVWDYLVGGADTETTLKRNRMAIDALQFRPKVLTDVREVTVSTELLGHPLRIPVILPPIGSVQLFEEGGGISVARGADAFGTMQILSSVAAPDFKAVAQATAGPKIYQLYLMGDQAWMDAIIAECIEAGYAGFCLTADTQVYSRRERDILKGWVPPSGSGSPGSSFDYQARMSWDTVAHIKETFDIPLVVKGINTADDANRAIDAGVDVIYVSNHGGRQLDHGRGCIDSLPEVARAVDGRAPIVVDGGFLRGADVVKALCRGADVVGMGRLEGFAMAAGGAAGIEQALKIVEHEIKTTMALMGARSLAELDDAWLEVATPAVAPHVLSALPLIDEY
ncbi:MAG: alpha-hydroxy acid oxidase [Pseudomonadota bacterium]